MEKKKFNDRGVPFKLGAGGDQKPVFLFAWPKSMHLAI